MSIRRRDFIKLFGAPFFLPHLNPLAPWFIPQALAQTAQTVRQNFIAVYFPNGAYMPGGTNGDWTFDGALQPLVAAGLRNNVMIIRKLTNGFADRDPHWQNTAGFLSGKKIVLDLQNAVVGESIDQSIARTKNTFLNSIEVGPSYYHIHQEADHPTYSSLFTNRISYDLQGRANNSISDPAQLYTRVFSVGEKNARILAHMRAKKKSILDVSAKDVLELQRRLPADQKPRLDVFTESLRSIERQLDRERLTCNASGINTSGNFSDINASFVTRGELMNQIVCVAIQCGLTNVASMMYGPAISGSLNFNAQIGAGDEHHSCAHNGGSSYRIDRMKQITRVYVRLYTHLLQQLKNANQLSNTLVLIGSDMSDGDTHNAVNLPVILAGEGADLKFGEEVVPSQTPITSLHLKIAQLFQVPGLTTMGEGDTLSSTPLNIIQR